MSYLALFRHVERYRYCRQGCRVDKRNGNTQHVRYLPGVEYRYGRNGQNKMRLAISIGVIRLWRNGAGETQLRFGQAGLNHHLLLELDGRGRMISREEYYPFGGTACWATRSQLMAQDKTRSYGAMERDATGLLAYGFRYYAPWLQRWINADPGGTVDGLNLMCFCVNNPITRGDVDGRYTSENLETTLLNNLHNSELPLLDVDTVDEVLAPPAETAVSLTDADFDRVDERVSEGLATASALQAIELPLISKDILDEVLEASPNSELNPTIIAPENYPVMLDDLLAGPSTSSQLEFKCEYCPKQCKTQGSLTKHLLMHYGGAYPCPDTECTRRFSHLTDANEHYKGHLNRTNFCCGIENCEKIFAKAGYLANHQQSEHPDFPITLTCPKCQMVFSTPLAINEHIRGEHLPDNAEATSGSRERKQHHCLYTNCGEFFDTAIQLGLHHRYHMIGQTRSNPLPSSRP